MTNRLEMVAFFRSKVEEPNRFARIDEGVLANEILDLGFCLVIERVVGGAHVREFGLAAASGDGPPRQIIPSRRIESAQSFRCEWICKCIHSMVA